MSLTKTILNTIVFFTLSFSMTAVAQTQQTGPVIFKVDGGAVHQSEADLTDSSGGFAVDRWFISAGMDYVWDQRTSLGFSIGGGKAIYEFNSESGFGGGAVWNKIDDMRVSATARFGFGNTGTMIIIPTVRWNGEKGSSASDSTYGLYAATAWQLNESLNIGPGIGVFSRLEGGTRFFPILAIDWTINDRWYLSTARGLAASQGPGLTLGYKLNDDWSFGISGRYEDIEFRLDDEGATAGGVGRDQSLPLVALATLTPNSTFKVSVIAGIELGGKLKLKDATGEVVEESSYDPAMIVGATFEIRF